MTKTALKLFLCWASVNVGVAEVTDDAPQVANVNFYCSTPGQVFNADCTEEFNEGGLTPDDFIMDIFNRCVYQQTGVNLDFSLPHFVVGGRKERALRTEEEAAAAATDETDGRSLQYSQCNACVCSEVCCILGYCGSSCSCTCACERRRLEDENEIISILKGGRQLQESIQRFTQEVELAVEESCTAQVRSFAILLRSHGNFCLGDGVVAETVGTTGQVVYSHEEIYCTPAVISTTHGR
jgi:hypothetical protein